MDRETSDRERLLIEAAQADPSRFAELYEAHFNRVWAFVIRRVRERAAAQDVTSARRGIRRSRRSCTRAARET